jgi:hypothetical protein
MFNLRESLKFCKLSASSFWLFFRMSSECHCLITGISHRQLSVRFAGKCKYSSALCDNVQQVAEAVVQDELLVA